MENSQSGARGRPTGFAFMSENLPIAASLSSCNATQSRARVAAATEPDASFPGPNT